MYSTRNSQGEELSKGQQEYFKDSQKTEEESTAEIHKDFAIQDSFLGLDNDNSFQSKSQEKNQKFSARNSLGEELRLFSRGPPKTAD